MIRSTRLLVTLAALAASSAFATGERIVLVPSDSPLRESLCFSMDCVADAADVTVTTRQVKGGLEVTVTANGQRKLAQTIPASDGQPSSTDLVKAAAAVFKAIEQPADTATAAAPAKGPAPVAKSSPKSKLHHLKLVARR